MTEVKVRPAQALKGRISAPGSKSYTHRYLLAGLLAHDESKLEAPSLCDDTLETLDVVEGLGARVREENDKVWMILGPGIPTYQGKLIHCKESGTTLRFTIPVAALSRSPVEYRIGAALMRRPLAELLASLKELGVNSELNTEKDHAALKISNGPLLGGLTRIRGNVSSQYVSGLLFAAPRTRKGITIELTSPLESRPYVEMTLEVMKQFGVKVESASDYSSFNVSGGQQYRGVRRRMEGDYSSAAFLLTAAAVTGSNMTVENLPKNSLQADIQIINILESTGIDVRSKGSMVEVEGRASESFELDAGNTPDLVPACTVLACFTKGRSRIFNASRLRYKESDRLTAISDELRKMGARVSVAEDELHIHGGVRLRGVAIDPHNDHRIAMACTVAGLGATGETVIRNAECVRKSYPAFFQDLQKIGANIVGG